MRWEPDAAKAIERVPFFVRKHARRKVEEMVGSTGREVVTLADVQRARDDQMARMSLGTASPAAPSPAAPTPPPAAPSSAVDLVGGTSGLSEAQIRRIEALADQHSHETRFYSVRSCGAAAGCPLAILDVEQMTRSVISAIEASGIADALASRIVGPVLSHHKFKVAVAGCPNACSEPQIRDFGLVAHSWPGPGDGECARCGECERVCRESAVRVLDSGPTLDLARCVGCGACAEVCPHGALAVERKGWRVLAGGRLGRHPRLAQTIAERATEAEALAMLNACLTLLKEEGRPGERLGQVLDRAGFVVESWQEWR